MSSPASTQPARLAEGPFDSLRDYVAAVEAHGDLVRIPHMDQDRYEATAFAYRLVEEFGFDAAPPFLIESLRIGGRDVTGPVLGNVFGGWSNEAMAFGAPRTSDNPRAMYRAAFNLLRDKLDEQGNWPRLAPTMIEPGRAPCKEVIAADVDIERFAWLQTNPGDAGRYITAGSVIVEDPELGRNVGTYRCQVKSADRIGVNTEIGQHAWSFLMRVKKQGRNKVPAAVVVGVDPITFALGTSKLAGLGEDELEIAGGLRGRPVDIVRCETTDICVPANAEIVLEGEISLTDLEEEGPYGEVYGYMGLKKPSNFVMQVKQVTHRHEPWIVNAFAGVTKLTMSMPQAVTNTVNYKKLIPNLVAFYRPIETTGVAIVSIDKRMPGEGMTAGQHIAAADLFAKAVIVVDGDIDVQDKTQIFHALGTRWQPDPATLVIPQTRGMPLDPSAPTRWLTSKVVIDATRQLPAEGGPESWPEVSRTIVEKHCEAAFELVDKNWHKYFKINR